MKPPGLLLSTPYSAKEQVQGAWEKCCQSCCNLLPKQEKSPLWIYSIALKLCCCVAWLLLHISLGDLTTAYQHEWYKQMWLSAKLMCSPQGDPHREKKRKLEKPKWKASSLQLSSEWMPGTGISPEGKCAGASVAYIMAESALSELWEKNQVFAAAMRQIGVCEPIQPSSCWWNRWMGLVNISSSKDGIGNLIH